MFGIVWQRLEMTNGFRLPMQHLMLLTLFRAPLSFTPGVSRCSVRLPIFRLSSSTFCPLANSSVKSRKGFLTNYETVIQRLCVADVEFTELGRQIAAQETWHRLGIYVLCTICLKLFIDFLATRAHQQVAISSLPLCGRDSTH
ncbi:uncharacterized protein LACBIDRAFT_304191 [Laccaria bicolor S238N-H82]|uniref:Predicted protein n=1 Tax=Laccaria bicolor (strain S238N-H82 / ATCC MYA-4686) TaxID=486041 RepID=B0DL57_LACBS|nr:uncharacterized protein LACBIDRAFT_304191 [Laccaria bicolor S238N-H82]EDR04852.1 predicted protein [Laccaria bicolor S238N-H82]|eukprot:XP_001884676.1 predicted protein [Laccaria bicolor S238N-H82]